MFSRTRIAKLNDEVKKLEQSPITDELQAEIDSLKIKNTELENKIKKLNEDMKVLQVKKL